LGGVDVPFAKGLLGHSDADVLVHAICDALLGAAAMGDIGQHFPDTDQAYNDINSLSLLRLVAHKLRAAGFSIVNVDSTIIAQKPKLAPYIPMMRQNIAEVVDLPVERVGVKATTTEGLGFEGRGEGFSAQAVALIQEEGDDRR
jgi:2-C-methyl-D-erythritol 2,4-cyclodiphosphate synthase